MTDLFDELAREAADVSSAPTDDQMAKLREKCVELVDADAEVSRLESELESAKERRTALAHKELPDIFGELGVDQFGLPDAGEHGVDLSLSPYYKASIPADWPDDQKAAAFDHLETIGGGDLVRTEVKFTLGRGQVELARTIVAMLRTLGSAMQAEGVGDIPAPSISMGVPWSSLTSFVKERTIYESRDEFASALLEAAQAGESPPEPTMDLGVLNATVGQVVKIKPRKEKK